MRAWENWFNPTASEVAMRRKAAIQSVQNRPAKPLRANETLNQKIEKVLGRHLPPAPR